MTTPIPAEHEGAPVTADTMSEVMTPAPAGRPPQDTVSPGTPETTAVSAVTERDYQKAYLLRQLEEAHGGKLAKGKANRFPRLVQRELNLIPTTANALRDELIQEGFVITARKGGSLTYELTDAGRVHLETLPQKALSADGGGGMAEAEVTEEVRQFRRTFLLFQLFESEGQALEQKVINRFREPGRKFLDLRAPVANEFRKVLEQEGLIEVDRQGKNATYRLTAAGREELGATAHFPDIELTIPGRVLNELLEAARDSAKQFEAPAVDTVAEEQPVSG